ncbi:MAG TPA: RNA-binding protein, partial [Anaeromyxobacteraceae bacterium]|nr:RNA-binding protein [Anaeromyxobacteraceae bacterium]
MTDEKKPTGPVVIRKGQITPPAEGVPTAQPAEAPATPAAAPEKPDTRPQWQRLADQKKAEQAGAATAGEAPAPGAPRPPRGDRGGP